MSLGNGINGDESYDSFSSSYSSSDNDTAAIAIAFEPYEGELLASGLDEHEYLT